MSTIKKLNKLLKKAVFVENTGFVFPTNKKYNKKLNKLLKTIMSEAGEANEANEADESNDNSFDDNGLSFSVYPKWEGFESTPNLNLMDVEVIGKIGYCDYPEWVIDFAEHDDLVELCVEGENSKGETHFMLVDEVIRSMLPSLSTIDRIVISDPCTHNTDNFKNVSVQHQWVITPTV
jgi:hypothetical protein